MKLPFINTRSAFFLSAIAMALAAAMSARAGLTLQLDVIHNVDAHVYTLAPNLSLNTNGSDSTPITFHEVYSPQTNASGNANFTGGVGTGSADTRDDFPDSDFNAFINAVTNGMWTLVMNVNSHSEKIYTFTVSSTLASNVVVATFIDYPPDGATNVLPLPTFEWHGPTNADTLLTYVISTDSSVFQYTNPSVLTTNIMLPPPLTNGDYIFVADYTKDISSVLASTIPIDASQDQAAGWVSTAAFDSGNQSSFTVVAPGFPPLPTGHTNVAHYAFDTQDTLGTDSSTNHNDINAGTGWGPGTPVHTNTPDAIAGGGAIQFFGFTSLVPLDQPFTNLSESLHGSFSVSAWIKTANVIGNDSDPLSDNTGQSIVYFSYFSPGTTPIGLTGSKLSFLTIDTNRTADTLHSTTSVTTGQYVHVVVTRNQMTGEKDIYFNGNLDATNTAGTNLLTGDTFALIGGFQATPYTGLLDDLQFYTGVLDSNDVSYLYANPGVALPDTAPTSANSELGAALNATNLFWSTSGDANWFAETNVSHDGISAAQSGSLVDNQMSVLQTTVIGPGTISFFWKTIANDDSFDLNFAINSESQDDISFDTDWTQGTFPIGPGTNVLTWTASTFSDTGSSTNDVGYVDQFVFTPPAPVTVTLINPQFVGSNFQFSFVSTAGHTNFVQTSTDLGAPVWTPFSTIPGDGTLKNVTVSAGSPVQQYFRVMTQ